MYADQLEDRIGPIVDQVEEPTTTDAGLGDVTERAVTAKLVEFPKEHGEDEDEEIQEDVEEDRIVWFNRKKEELPIAGVGVGDSAIVRAFFALESVTTPFIETVALSKQQRQAAAFVTSDGIKQMNTKEIIDVLSALLPSRPLGLEWVDDVSVVVLWKTNAAMREAFEYLTGEPPDYEHPLHYLAVNTSIDVPAPFFVRIAFTADVKVKNAASKSEYYRDQRRREGRESKPYDRPARREPQRRGRPRTTADDLDAELDAYLNQNQNTTKEDLDADLDRSRAERERAETGSRQEEL